MSKQRQVFVYDDVEDADIARWLATQSNKSAAIRHAIRASIRSSDGLDEPTLRQILREELAQVAIANRSSDTAEEDPEAAARLDGMF